MATGKSTVSNLFTRLLNAERFDSDRVAKELLDADPEVKAEVKALFGTKVFDSTGNVERAMLRDIVFHDSERRKRLEAILHPRIRERWTRLGEVFRSSERWFVVEVPLLFETGAEQHCDVVIVVACRASTQMNRMMNQRGLSAELAERMLRVQHDLGAKVGRAKHVIWSDSPVACVEEQAQILARYLQDCNG